MFDLNNVMQLSKISKLDFNEEELIKMVSVMKPVIELMDVIHEYDEEEKEEVLIKTTSFSELRDDTASEKNSISTGDFAVPRVV